MRDKVPTSCKNAHGTQFNRLATVRLLRNLRLLAVSLLWTVASDAAQVDAKALGLITEAEAKWTAAMLTNYSYELSTWSAFDSNLTKVRVRDGVCSALTRSLRRRRQEWKSISCEGHTIPEILAAIRKEIEAGCAESRLQFDSRYGYVVSATVFPNTELSDQEWSVDFGKFRTHGRK